MVREIGHLDGGREGGWAGGSRKKGKEIPVGEKGCHAPGYCAVRAKTRKQKLERG